MSTPYTLSAVGATPAVPLINSSYRNTGLQPGVLVIVAPGSVLTYTVEVTADGYSILNPPWTPQNWAPFDVMTGLTGTATATLFGSVTGMRCRITAFVSGSLTFQVTV